MLVEHAPISAPQAQKLVDWLLRRHGSRAPEIMHTRPHSDRLVDIQYLTVMVARRFARAIFARIRRWPSSRRCRKSHRWTPTSSRTTDRCTICRFSRRTVIERTVVERLVAYLQVNDRPVATFSFGVRRHHSTETALLRVLSECLRRY